MKLQFSCLLEISILVLRVLFTQETNMKLFIWASLPSHSGQPGILSLSLLLELVCVVGLGPLLSMASYLNVNSDPCNDIISGEVEGHSQRQEMQTSWIPGSGSVVGSSILPTASLNPLICCIFSLASFSLAVSTDLMKTVIQAFQFALSSYVPWVRDSLLLKLTQHQVDCPHGTRSKFMAFFFNTV